MKIKEIRLDKFKRFTDLTIKNIPANARLVVLVGPNGSGKSSLFDAFNVWYTDKAYEMYSSREYCNKESTDDRNAWNLVNIVFHEDISSLRKNEFKSFFYFRTAYRNSPELNVKTISKIRTPLEFPKEKRMIDNDCSVNDNYQLLVSHTLSKIYDSSNDFRLVKDVREDLVGRVQASMKNLFPDLIFSGMESPVEKAAFYFTKGSVKKYGYEKLSGGEKAAFDLLLDLLVKTEFYNDSVFCIDEPEVHIHTALQAKLLRELFEIIGKKSQLWIATHSFGMMKEAEKLSKENPGEVVFIDFDGYDFDDKVTLEPRSCDSVLWKKILAMTLDDYALLLIPNTIVFCEGSTSGNKRKDFDARCFENIFKNKRGVMFYSLGSCNDIEKDEHAVMDFIEKLSPGAEIIKVVDRDDRSDDDVEYLLSKGIRVLSVRNIEGYLLAPEVIEKWCDVTHNSEKKSEALKVREDGLMKSVERGNAPDDLKKAANDICLGLKNLFKVVRCGNNGESIMRDTLSKLITEDMQVYKLIENDIFGDKMAH